MLLMDTAISIFYVGYDFSIPKIYSLPFFEHLGIPVLSEMNLFGEIILYKNSHVK